MNSSGLWRRQNPWSSAMRCAARTLRVSRRTSSHGVPRFDGRHIQLAGEFEEVRGARDHHVAALDAEEDLITLLNREGLTYLARDRDSTVRA